mmetsp:Transcript_114551/g.370124  ORF Transcript_114551/g.370124 Transcript_114551/m.370124 type:complete len:255 (-) Transcript_114551:7-771(-)
MARPRRCTRGSSCARVPTKREFSRAATLFTETSQSSSPAWFSSLATGTRALTTCPVPMRSRSTRHCTSRSFVSQDCRRVQRLMTRQASTSEPFIQKPFSQDPKVWSTPPVCRSSSGFSVPTSHCFCACCSLVGTRTACCCSSCSVSSQKKLRLLLAGDARSAATPSAAIAAPAGGKGGGGGGGAGAAPVAPAVLRLVLSRRLRPPSLGPGTARKDSLPPTARYGRRAQLPQGRRAHPRMRGAEAARQAARLPLA